jgi:hypothetical protein
VIATGFPIPDVPFEWIAIVGGAWLVAFAFGLVWETIRRHRIARHRDPN